MFQSQPVAGTGGRPGAQLSSNLLDPTPPRPRLRILPASRAGFGRPPPPRALLEVKRHPPVEGLACAPIRITSVAMAVGWPLGISRPRKIRLCQGARPVSSIGRGVSFCLHRPAHHGAHPQRPSLGTGHLQQAWLPPGAQCFHDRIDIPGKRAAPRKRWRFSGFMGSLATSATPCRGELCSNCLTRSRRRRAGPRSTFDARIRRRSLRAHRGGP